MAKHYVFLDPDGSFELGVHVLIEARTGVVYGNQCNGAAAEERRVEGFLVPLGMLEQEEALSRFFCALRGNRFAPRTLNWSTAEIDALNEIVQTIEYWECELDGEDTLHSLTLDYDRIKECVEAWVPVKTPGQRGYLVWKNSD